MSEQHKVTCSVTPDGMIQAQMLLRGGHLPVKQISATRTTLVEKRGSLITDFAMVPVEDEITTGLYTATVTMPEVITPEKQLVELMRFTDAMMNLAGTTCTIDCSQLAQRRLTAHRQHNGHRSH